MKKTLFSLLTLSWLAISAPAATVQYQVTIDTSGFTGTGQIQWWLVPGNSPIPSVTAIILDEMYGTGTPGAYSIAAGTPTFAPPLLDNQSPASAVARALAFGSFISFTVNLSGPGVDDTTVDGTTFSFHLTEDDGTTPKGTLLQTAVGTIDVGGGFTPVATALAAGVTLSEVPEPATLLLAGAALLAFGAKRRRAARRR